MNHQNTNYLFTNLIGSFVLDSNLKIINQIPFKNLEEYQHKEITENKLHQKYSQLQILPIEKLPQVLELFKDAKYYEQFYQRNLQLTKQAVKASVSEDLLIIQAISNISELDKVINLLTKRLSEWYSLYLPELVEKYSHQEKLVELICQKSKKELLQLINLKTEESMGADLEMSHVEEIQALAKKISDLYKLRRQHEDYLKIVMKKYCPNILELAGVTIGAKLLELAHSLKHLALLPASTVQLLGAEKALFRHIKTGSKSPKYGIIINHPLIQNAPRDLKGKASRMLADKLSLCARLDYFQGEFKAPEYRTEVEEALTKSATNNENSRK